VTSLGTQRVWIGKLRLGGVRDPWLGKARFESALAAADIQPRGLSREAILIVRRLRTPALAWERSLEPGALRPWESAVRARLDELARRAARPFLSPVPSDAEAVLFADRAEWLTCLVREALQRQLAGAWWYGALLRQAGARREVVRAMHEAVEVLPTVLAELAQLGLTVRLPELISEPEARALLESLAERHGAPRLVTALCDPVSESELAAGRQPADFAKAAPFLAHGRELPAGHGAVSALVGIGLSLARGAARARSDDFQRAVRSWVVATALHAQQDAAPAGRVSASRHAAAMDRAPRSVGEAAPAYAGDTSLVGMPERSTLSAHERAPGQGARLPPANHLPVDAAPAINLDEVAPTSKQELARGLPAAAPEHVLARTGHDRDGLAQEAADPVHGSRGRDALPSPAWSEAARPVHEQVIDTSLGGLFFLVFVSIRLGFYADFSTPRQPGISLPLWDFLSLIGRQLLGPDHDPPDPVWPLLATLSGRLAGEPLGHGFDVPDAWLIPRAWLAAFVSGESWGYGERDGRVVVRHASGFVVADSAAASDVSQQLTALLSDYAPPRLVPDGDTVLPPAGDALARWSFCVASYVEARLAAALAVPKRDVADMVLRRRARVVVSREGVAIHMSLSHHPIELRVAGLDRDVGWLPCASRSLTFHFEDGDS
jgi:hypothetical protein